MTQVWGKTEGGNDTGRGKNQGGNDKVDKTQEGKY